MNLDPSTLSHEVRRRLPRQLTLEEALQVSGGDEGACTGDSCSCTAASADADGAVSMPGVTVIGIAEPTTGQSAGAVGSSIGLSSAALGIALFATNPIGAALALVGVAGAAVNGVATNPAFRGPGGGAGPTIGNPMGDPTPYGNRRAR